MTPPRLLTTLLLFSGLSPAVMAASVQQLAQQGRWTEAAYQAETDKDYATAALMLDRLMECPSPSQPNGQHWDAALSKRGLALAQKAASVAQTPQQASDAQLMIATHVGHLAGLAQENRNLAGALSGARDSKVAFEKAVQQMPQDLQVNSTYAMYLARSLGRGAFVLGISKGSAQMALSTSVRLFNTAPDATREQQLAKAVGALRIAEAYEGMSDIKLKPFFEAAIKLGLQAGGGEGRCLANVARIHLKQPLGDF